MSDTPAVPFLLVVEGIDGAGKSTLAVTLSQELERCGFNVVLTKEPTYGKHGAKLRASAATGRVAPKEEMELLLADRRDHVAHLIRPALDKSKIVLLDRYYYSNAAYQGSEGLDPERILEVNQAFAPRPDLVLLLDVPPTTGLARISHRGDIANHFEKEDTLARCRDIFLGMTNPEIVRIDAAESAQSVFQAALRYFVFAYAEKAKALYGVTIEATKALMPLFRETGAKA